MTETVPFRIGLAGLGGYAGYICDRILEELKGPDPAVSLVAVCDPVLERFGARVRDLNNHGIQTLRSFEQLLASDIEAVWLPIPIDLHCSYTAAALAAGKAVICEKPVAGCIDDVDSMIAARDQSGLAVAVGFQDIYQPSVATLKRRFVAGEFGHAHSATVVGCWPRSERYFGRNDWAGRTKRDGRWVMDSPASNALAHFINLTMFLLGPESQTSAVPTHVAAELYRANKIENFDTCSLRITLTGDIPLYVAYTHACAATVDPVITIETEHAIIRYVAGRHIEIRAIGADVDVEVLPLVSHPHTYILRNFRSWMRDGVASAPGATLEIARQHVLAMNVISETAAIVDIPGDQIETVQAADHAPLRAVRDIIPALQACATQKTLLCETGLAPWSIPAASHAVPRNYTHFAGPHPPRASVTVHPQLARRPAATSAIR